MWGYVKDNKVEEIIRFPKTIVIDNIKHPRAIFNTWTWEQLNTIGLYEVVDSGSKGNDKFEYTSQAQYSFSSKNKNITTSYTITEKALDDENAKNEDGSDMKDPITGEQVINYGLKTLAIEQTKRTANSFISRFNWLVERSIYDSSKTIPKELSDYVSSIRADSDAIETAINGATTMKKFKALYDDEYNEDGTIKTQNRMGRWTDDKTVKKYLR
tara:strand:- start:44 stop:685 length:642 start_codon:yes stop_codon:yes gene_type:complete